MNRCVRVIADDLTGAADAGVAFSRHGRSVVLVLDDGTDKRPDCAQPHTDVSVIDTDTREASCAQARDAVTAAMRDVPPGCTVLKKVDSLLRGHVAAEVDAIRKVLPERLVVVAPALPALDRPTRG